MRLFRIRVVMPSGERMMLDHVPGADMRQVAYVFWQMWLQPEMPHSVFIEEEL